MTSFISKPDQDQVADVRPVRLSLNSYAYLLLHILTLPAPNTDTQGLTWTEESCFDSVPNLALPGLIIKPFQPPHKLINYVYLYVTNLSFVFFFWNYSQNNNFLAFHTWPKFKTLIQNWINSFDNDVLFKVPTIIYLIPYFKMLEKSVYNII